MGIIQSVKKSPLWPKSTQAAKEEFIKREEEAALAKFDEFTEMLEKEYNCKVIPDVILGFSPIKGVTPITHQFAIISNRRFEK